MSEWSRVISETYASRWKFALASTAGGSAVSRLLEVAGASTTLLQLTIPYAAAALQDLLQHTPDQYCSAETALAMACVSYHFGVQLENGHADDVVGVGATASLVSDRPKRGEHRCFVATQTSESTRLASVVLSKGQRNRAEEDRIVGDLILDAMGAVAGIANRPTVPLTDQDHITVESATCPPGLQSVWRDSQQSICRLPDSQFVDRPEPLPMGMLCGSFNPRHPGHDALKATAERKLNGPVYFELTIRNADKPPLDFLTLQRRCDQFNDVPLLLTSVPTFAERARQFPSTVFIVGIDTAVRIVDPRFYGSEQSMHEALAQFRAHGCRFLVAGRIDGDRFVTLSDFNLESEFADLFEELPDFRMDISSTELRE